MDALARVRGDPRAVRHACIALVAMLADAEAAKVRHRGLL